MVINSIYETLAQGPNWISYSQMIGPMVRGSQISELETERCVLLVQGWEMGVKKQTSKSKTTDTIKTQFLSAIDYGLAMLLMT